MKTGSTSAPSSPRPDCPILRASALASFSNGEAEFYAANEGESTASLLGFQLEESAAELSSATEGSPQLLSLNETSLALLGTFLTVTLETQNDTEESVEGETAAVAAAAPGGAGQSLFGRLRSTTDDADVIALDAEGIHSRISPRCPIGPAS